MAALRENGDAICAATDKLTEELIDFHEAMHDAGISPADAFCMVITIDRKLTTALEEQ